MRVDDLQQAEVEQAQDRHGLTSAMHACGCQFARRIDVGTVGEEQWIEHRPMDAAMLAARRRHAVPAALACAAQMALLLVYWELMARYHDRDVRPCRSRS